MSTIGAIGEGLVELSLGPGSDQAGLGYGGDAANVCVMAARLGADARLVGRVGDDPLGRRLTDFWSANGVDLTAVRVDDGAPTGLYVNEAASGGRHRFTYLRADSAGSRLDVDDVDPRFFEGLDTLVVTGITLAVSRSSAAAVHAAVEEARRRGTTIACVLNHRPALAGDQGELADVALASDVVVGSREDLEGVFGDAEEGLVRLDEQQTEREIVITDGSGSATVSWGGGSAVQPTPAVEVRNSAGAGDALAGAYLAIRLDDRPPSDALAWGVAAAALSVTGDGCSASYPSAGETARAVDGLPEQESLGAGRTSLARTAGGG